MPTDGKVFEIGAPGVDVEHLVGEVLETVRRRTEEGAYADARVARAERSNLAALRQDAEALRFYLDCLREAAYVDINDFDIRERRQGLGRLLRLLKQTIWKLLKFYTYRLWSQQNQINGLLVGALEGLQEEQAGRLRKLEERLAALEARREGTPRGDE